MQKYHICYWVKCGNFAWQFSHFIHGVSDCLPVARLKATVATYGPKIDHNLWSLVTDILHASQKLRHLTTSGGFPRLICRYNRNSALFVDLHDFCSFSRTFKSKTKTNTDIIHFSIRNITYLLNAPCCSGSLYQFKHWNNITQDESFSFL